MRPIHIFNPTSTMRARFHPFMKEAYMPDREFRNGDGRIDIELWRRYLKGELPNSPPTRFRGLIVPDDETEEYEAMHRLAPGYADTLIDAVTLTKMARFYQRQALVGEYASNRGSPNVTAIWDALAPLYTVSNLTTVSLYCYNGEVAVYRDFIRRSLARCLLVSHVGVNDKLCVIWWHRHALRHTVLARPYYHAFVEEVNQFSAANPYTTIVMSVWDASLYYAFWAETRHLYLPQLLAAGVDADDWKAVERHVDDITLDYCEKLHLDIT